MNPGLKLHQTEYESVPFRDNTRNQNQTAFKKLKVKHYLKTLDDSGVPSPMLEHISDFFQSLLRRNRSVGFMVQCFHGLKRFFVFYKSLGITRLEFEYRTPVIPQLNFKNISSKMCQVLEPESLNCHNLIFQRMLIQEYKQILSQVDHGCGYPRYSGVLKFYLLF